MKKKCSIIMLLLFFLINMVITSEISLSDIRMIHLLNTMNINQEYNFSFLLNHSAEELTILLNVSFAKYGRPFKGRKIRDIFQNTIWYITNPYYTDNMLTPTDKNNVLKITSIITLTPENETLLYKLKRIKQLQSESYPTNGLQLLIDSDNGFYQLEGKIIDTKNIWKHELNIIEINKKIPIALHGTDGWFIYKNTYYFFIEEIFMIDMNSSYKIRRYITCTFDYNKKVLDNINFEAAITEEF